MLELPASERMRFEARILGHAARYGVSPTDYLRGIWYHEAASALGEYVALTFVEELVQLAPPLESEEEADAAT